ncbi:MAG TPA: aminotransferase class I/II-fold pyridoxal phosphate-dependent enzyme [Thermoanaerobaculia bacterium]|nr:aminotransferase class I/II-fold pyridoxal phosphate-dependent enzyme [Thermoanaerobaculia bacterium]
MELAQPISRRRFAGLLGAGLASAALRPAAPAAAATPTPAASPDPNGIVRLSSNENPYGPPPAAFDAMRQAFDRVWRYPDEAADGLIGALARLHGVGNDQVLLGNGSGEILKICAAAFTGPGRPVVMASPTFEAIGRYTRAAGGEVIQVPLTSDHGHDLAKMLEAARFAGLVYVCNPNNPTGSVTPDLRGFLARLPAGTAVLVDEAYHHYSKEGTRGNPYESVIPLVAEHSNLIVARTFSKIYGMAGLRCGYAIGRPEALERLRFHQAWDTVNIQALVAARAALDDTAHLERSRRLNRETRAWVTGELAARGYASIPSHTNFLMTDLRRDVGPVIDALRKHRVEVGRRFTALPTHLRVTLGTRPQMERFLGALGEVLAAPPT